MRLSRSGYAPATRPSTGHPAATSNEALAPPPHPAATATANPRARRARADVRRPGTRRRWVTREAYRRPARGAFWHLVRASHGWCAGAPDHRRPDFGTRVPLPCGVAGPSMSTKPTCDRTGDSTWGVGHGTGNGRSLEEVRGRDPGPRSRAE